MNCNEKFCVLCISVIVDATVCYTIDGGVAVALTTVQYSGKTCIENIDIVVAKRTDR